MKGIFLALIFIVSSSAFAQIEMPLTKNSVMKKDGTYGDQKGKQSPPPADVMPPNEPIPVLQHQPAQEGKNIRPTGEVEPVLKIGDKIITFSLKNVDGKNYNLSNAKKKKAYCIIFTCNHCPFSVKYEDRIIALHKKYGSKVEFVAINPNDPSIVEEDSYENMIIRAKEKNFKFPYLFDEGQFIMKAYGARKTPHIFLFDKDYKLAYMGGIDDNSDDPESVEQPYLANAIDALLKGQKPDVEITKAIGCSVKVKKKS